MSALSSTSAVLFSFWNMKWTLTFPIGFQHIERKMQIPPQAHVTQRLPPSLAPCSSAVQPQCLPAVPETKLGAFTPAHDILSPQIAAWSFSLIFYIFGWSITSLGGSFPLVTLPLFCFIVGCQRLYYLLSSFPWEHKLCNGRDFVPVTPECTHTCSVNICWVKTWVSDPMLVDSAEWSSVCEHLGPFCIPSSSSVKWVCILQVCGGSNNEMLRGQMLACSWCCLSVLPR